MFRFPSSSLWYTFLFLDVGLPLETTPYSLGSISPPNQIMGFLRTLKTRKAKKSKTHQDSFLSAQNRVKFIFMHLDTISRRRWIPRCTEEWEEFESEVGQAEAESTEVCSLIPSVSSLETIDDQPGTGRTIDKFFYQPAGRALERLLTNLELRYFHTPEKNAKAIVDVLGVSDMHFEDRTEPYGVLTVTRGKLPIANADIGLLFQSHTGGMDGLKALYKLLSQAGSGTRSLRVSSQKQLWRLCRLYKHMSALIDSILGLEFLALNIRDTFANCSVDDLDLCFAYYRHWRSAQSLFKITAHTLCADHDCVSSVISLQKVLRSYVHTFSGFVWLPIFAICEPYYHAIYHPYEPTDINMDRLDGIYHSLVAIRKLYFSFPDSMRPTFDAIPLINFPDTSENEDLLPLLCSCHKSIEGCSLLSKVETLVHVIVYSLVSATERCRYPDHFHANQYQRKITECIQRLIEHEFPVQLRDTWNQRRAVEDYLGQIIEHMALLGRSFAAFKQSVINGCLSHHIRWKDVATKYMEGNFYPSFLRGAKPNPARTWQLVILYDDLKNFRSGSVCYLPFWTDSSSDCPESVNDTLANQNHTQFKCNTVKWCSQLRLDNFAVDHLFGLHPALFGALLPYMSGNLLPYQVHLPQSYNVVELQNIYKDVISRNTAPPSPQSPTVTEFRSTFELDGEVILLPTPIYSLRKRTNNWFELQEAAYFGKVIQEKYKTGAFFKDIRNHSGHDGEIDSRMQERHVRRAQDSEAMEVEATYVTKDCIFMGDHEDRGSLSDRSIHRMSPAAGTHTSNSFLFDNEQRRPLSDHSNIGYDGLFNYPELTRSEPQFSPEHTSRSNRLLPPIAEESDSLCAGDSSSSESEDFWSAKSTAELSILTLD